MAVVVKFFANLREQMGRGEQRLEDWPGGTVSDVWQAVSGDGDLDTHVLAAVNQSYSERDQPVADGDEVAFFPPVTGG